MGAQLERVAILHDQLPLVVGSVVVCAHHGERLGRCHHGGGGEGLHEAGDVCRVVGLHVLDHQVIGRATGERGIQVGEPLVAEVHFHGIHDGDLLVEDDVGVVCHAERHVVLPLEQVDVVVVHADVDDISGDVHENPSVASLRRASLYRNGRGAAAVSQPGSSRTSAALAREQRSGTRGGSESTASARWGACRRECHAAAQLLPFRCRTAAFRHVRPRRIAVSWHQRFSSPVGGDSWLSRQQPTSARTAMVA